MKQIFDASLSLFVMGNGGKGLLRLFGLSLHFSLGASFRSWVISLGVRTLFSTITMFAGGVAFFSSLLTLHTSLIRNQRYLHVDGPVMHLQSLERLQRGELILLAVELDKTKALASAVAFFNYMRALDGHLFGEDLLELGVFYGEGKIRDK